MQVTIMICCPVASHVRTSTKPRVDTEQHNQYSATRNTARNHVFVSTTEFLPEWKEEAKAEQKSQNSVTCLHGAMRLATKTHPRLRVVESLL